MARRTRKEVPAPVARLRKQIEQWRQTRLKRGSMPEELWREAVSLARRGSPYRVARALRIDFGTLRLRIAESSARAGSAPPGEFVELSGAQILGSAAGSVVELSDGDGKRLTIRLAATEKLDLAELVRGFCARGA